LVSEGVTPPSHGGAESERGLLRTLGDYSALIAIVAAAIYVLGLFSLLVPIMNAYEGGFTSAWYAVSLVPRNLIAGQGLRQLVFGPIMYFVAFFVAFAITTAIIIFWPPSAAQEETEEIGRTRPRDLIEFLLKFITVTLSVLVTTASALSAIEDLLSAAVSLVPREISAASASVVLALATPILVGTAVGVYVGRNRGTDVGLRGAIFIHHSVRAPILTGLVVAFLAAYVIAGFREPPLPTVHISWDKGSTRGELLAHADGFWYVYNDENRLEAIPDDKVDEVGVPE
jgi:hypothetical protein